MRDTSGQSKSVWMETANLPQLTPLVQGEHADVCVVGAGIAGLTTAYLLARQGKRVVVVDDGPVGGGQTQRTTAHLSNALDKRYFEIERLHGEHGARLAAESHTAAMDRIEAIIRDEQIACDFARLDGYLFLSPGEDAKLLDRELAAARSAGLTQIERLQRVPLDFLDTGPCLRFPRQGQFHPLKYLAGLARSIQQMGGKLFTGTHVDRIDGGSPAQITTGNGPVITADAVVVATNIPINDLLAIHTKQAPYLSYVIGASVPHGSIPKSLYWDTGEAGEGEPSPYHYIRLDVGVEKNSDILIVGGEDHKTGQADDADERYSRLETWARDRFPMMREIKYWWSGQVMESNDGLAFIGRNPMDKANVFVVTGDSGMGMTHGTIAGMLLTDIIFCRENPWTELYDPSRKSLRAVGQFIKENLNVAKQYGDWLTGGDVSSPDEIEQGAGALIRRGVQKVAVYRDEQGSCHELSAICPHLGCVVHWNGTEKTWDCPCHGSRFDRVGKVISGPANRDLKPPNE